MSTFTHHHPGAARRFLRLLSPRHQLMCNPVIGLGWLLAVGCTAAAPVFWLLGLQGWIVLALIAGLLWLNAIAASVCEWLFGPYDTLDSTDDRRHVRRRK